MVEVMREQLVGVISVDLLPGGYERAARERERELRLAKGREGCNLVASLMSWMQWRSLLASGTKMANMLRLMGLPGAGERLASCLTQCMPIW